MKTVNFDHQPNIFRKLKSSLNEFQKTLHPEDPNSEVSTVFVPFTKKVLYHYTYTEKLRCVATDFHEHRYSYTVSTRPHGLLGTDIEVNLPYIECQPGYTARWTLNIGSNIFECGELILNDKILQKLNYIYNDSVGQTSKHNSDRCTYNFNIGNFMTDENFKSKIPRFTTTYKPEWMYTQDLNYFPLMYLGYLDTFSHSYSFRLKLKKLLEIRDPAGNPVEFSKQSVSRINNIKDFDDNYSLEVPNVYGHYLIFTDSEYISNIQKCESSEKVFTPPSIYYHDIETFKSKNNELLGLNATIPIKSDYPCVALRWNSQNQNAIKYNFYSNYSTNSKDDRLGLSPIGKVSLKMGTGDLTIFEDAPGYRFERVNPLSMGLLTPSRPGYGIWSPSIKHNVTNVLHPGIIFSEGSTLTFTLQDADPVLDCTEETCVSPFIIHVNMVVIRKLTWEEFPKTEKQRESMKSLSNIDTI